jgi:hypothetical protein
LIVNRMLSGWLRENVTYCGALNQAELVVEDALHEAVQ